MELSSQEVSIPSKVRDSDFKILLILRKFRNSQLSQLKIRKMFAITDEDKCYSVENGRTVETDGSAFFSTQNLHAISIDSKFSIHPGSDDSDSLFLSFPLFPNERILARDFLNRHYKARFAVKNKHADQFKSVRHISEFIPLLSGLKECRESACTFLLLIRGRAVMVVKRISEYLYFNIEGFENAEELLYHINRVYLEQNLSRESDRLVLLGEISDDSRILNLIRSYFRNVSVPAATNILNEIDTLIQQKA